MKLENLKTLIDFYDSLYGKIFPTLRGVGINIKNRVITTVFYYDGKVGDREVDAVYFLEGELFDLGYLSWYQVIEMSDLKLKKIEEEKGYLERYFYYLGEFIVEQVDSSKAFDDNCIDYWIYIRKEGNPLFLHEYNLVTFDENIKLDAKINIIIQNSLLGLITSSVRFINFDYHSRGDICIRFIYDGEVGGPEEDISLSIEKIINVELPEFNIKVINIRHDYPNSIINLKYDELAMNLKVIFARAKECLGCWD